MIGIGENVAAGLPDSRDDGGNVVDELVARARDAEAAGVDTVWLPQGYGFDTLTTYG